MWEQARLAELLINTKDTMFTGVDHYFNGESVSKTLPQSTNDIVKLYENLIIEFPSGFYASSARERLREIENRSTS